MERTVLSTLMKRTEVMAAGLKPHDCGNWLYRTAQPPTATPSMPSEQSTSQTFHRLPDSLPTTHAKLTLLSSYASHRLFLV
jgi:hypothetical protein